MKRRISAFIIILSILGAVATTANAISLSVNNTPAAVSVTEINSISYVPLRAVTRKLCPSAEISWENNQAVVRTSDLTLTARPGDCYINANGRILYARDGIILINDSVYIPIRVLAKALGATVAWNGNTNSVYVTSGSGTILSGNEYYNSDAVYWLSRIISAESRDEPLIGQIAVGNVILNRVASPEFPNSIYGVIFDAKWGIQFEPVKNGTIYDTPTEDSILAAKLCLDGASAVGDSTYFLNPAKASNFWAVQNCMFYSTIGNHQFYA